MLVHVSDFSNNTATIWTAYLYLHDQLFSEFVIHQSSTGPACRALVLVLKLVLAITAKKLTTFGTRKRFFGKFQTDFAFKLVTFYHSYNYIKSNYQI